MGYLQDQEKQINSQYDSELNNRLQQIQHARDQAINDLNKQMKDESLNFHNQRVDLDTQKAMETMRAKEMMAGMGSYNSGDNITAMSRISNNRARGMDGITGSENQFNRDINHRIGQTRTNATNQEQDIRNTVGMERAKAMQSARDRAYQMEQQAAAQRAAAQRAAAAQKAASSKPTEYEKYGFTKQFSDLLGNDINKARQLLFSNTDAIVERYGQKYYSDLLGRYTNKLSNNIANGFKNTIVNTFPTAGGNGSFKEY